MMIDTIVIVFCSIGFISGIVSLIFLRSYLTWTKWELVEENKKVSVVQTNPIMGKISEGNMFVNVYKKVNKRTGLEKFKSVPTI